MIRRFRFWLSRLMFSRDRQTTYEDIVKAREKIGELKFSNKGNSESVNRSGVIKVVGVNNEDAITRIEELKSRGMEVVDQYIAEEKPDYVRYALYVDNYPIESEGE